MYEYYIVQAQPFSMRYTTVINYNLQVFSEAVTFAASSRMSTDQNQSSPQHTKVIGIYAAVKEQWGFSRHIWTVPGRSGQAGPCRAVPGRAAAASALSSREAKLILSLRPLCCDSAKACSPAAAGNCLQCRCPWNGNGSPSTCTVCVCDLTNPNPQVYFIFDNHILKRENR